MKKTLLALLLLVSCKSAEDQAHEQFVIDSTRTADSLSVVLKPRQEIYAAATALVREDMKVPSSTRFASIQPENTDSSAIMLLKPDSAVVYGKYESQNSFGVFLPGKFKATLQKLNGKWGIANPSWKFILVHSDYTGTWNTKPETEAKNSSNAPPPPPPADTSLY